MRYVLTNDKFNSTLEKFVEDSMIMEFESFDEIKDFINLNCPDIEEKIESVKDLERVLGEYYFNYNGRFYDIMFDEALEIRDYLPRGFFEMPQKLKRTNSYKEFVAFVDGMLEVNNSTRNKYEIINHYSQIIGEDDWVIKATDIKSKMDFKCFKYDDFSEDERNTFVENLKDKLGLESIDIDDPKTWLPQLKKEGYIEDISFDIENIDDSFYDILDRLYNGIEEYNDIVYLTQNVIAYYNKYYDDYDETYIAFSVGRVCELDNEIVNHYPREQKRVFEMAKKCWKEFDGFNYDLED